MIIAYPATQIAKGELHYLMGTLSTDEECEDAFGRMIKISQSSVLSISTVIDTVFGSVVAGRGSVDDVIRKLERRYGICTEGSANRG